MGKGKTAAHSTPGKAVDAVFGEYTKGRSPPPLKMGVNIGDAWKKKEDKLSAGGAAAEDAAVAWRVQKILDGDDAVSTLDREHGAIQSRATEATRRSRRI